MCLFPFSFLPVSFLNLTLTSYRHKNAFINNPPTANKSQKKNDSQEKENFSLSFSHLEASARGECHHDKLTHEWFISNKRTNRREIYEILTRSFGLITLLHARTLNIPLSSFALSDYAERKRHTATPPRNRQTATTRETDRPVAVVAVVCAHGEKK